MCALPFHATPQFARLLRLLQLDGGRWGFLSTAKVCGAPPTRAALALAVARDPALLVCVADAAAGALSAASRSAPAFSASFYILLLCDALCGMPASLPPSLLPKLIPLVEAAFGDAAGADVRAGGLMLSACLATRTQLSPPLAAAVAEGSAKCACPPHTSAALGVLLALCRSTGVRCLSQKTITDLAKVPALAQRLADLQATHDTAPLRRAIVASLLNLPGSSGNLSIPQLLGECFSCGIAAGEEEQTVRDMCAAASAGSAQALALAHPLRALYMAAPVPTTRAIASLLHSCDDDSMKSFLALALAGTALAPVTGAASVTLTQALGSRDTSLRIAALHQLAVTADTAGAASMGSSVLDALDDEHPGIAAAAFALPIPVLIECCGRTALEDALDASVARLSETAARNTTASTRAATALTLRLRVGAAPLLLLRALAGCGGEPLASAALRLARSSDHPLFKPLANDPSRPVLDALGEALSGSDGTGLCAFLEHEWAGFGAVEKCFVLSAMHSALSSSKPAAEQLALASCAFRLVQHSTSGSEADALLSQIAAVARSSAEQSESSGMATSLFCHITASGLDGMPGAAAAVVTLVSYAASADSSTWTPAVFLTRIVVAPPGDSVEATRVRALTILSAKFPPHAVLPSIAALESPYRGVRAAAVEYLEAGGSQAHAATPVKGKSIRRGASTPREVDLSVSAAMHLAAWAHEHASELRATHAAAEAKLRSCVKLHAPVRALLCRALLEYLVVPECAVLPLTAFCGCGAEAEVGEQLSPLSACLEREDFTCVDAALLRLFVAAAEAGSPSCNTILVTALRGRASAAAAGALSPLAFAKMDARQQTDTLCALVKSAADVNASRDALQRLSLSGAVFGCVLDGALLVPSSTSAKRTRRASTAAPARQTVDTALLHACLEASLWLQLSEPAGAAPALGRAFHALFDGEERASESGAPELHRSSFARSSWLVLKALRLAVSTSPEAAAAVGAPLLVRTLRSAPDAASREAAVELVSTVATAAPHSVASCCDVLTAEVVASASDSRAALHAAVDAMRALAPAAVHCHNDGGASLVVAVTRAALPRHCRADLLIALCDVLPQPSALFAALRALLVPAHESTEPDDGARELAWSLCMASTPSHACAAAAQLLASVPVCSNTAVRCAMWCTQLLQRVARSPPPVDPLRELVAAALPLLHHTSGDAVDGRAAGGAVLLIAERVMGSHAYGVALAVLFASNNQDTARSAMQLATSRARAFASSSSKDKSWSATATCLLSAARSLFLRSETNRGTQKAALRLLAAVGSSADSDKDAVVCEVSACVRCVCALPQSAHTLHAIAACLPSLRTAALPLLPCVAPCVLACVEKEGFGGGFTSAALDALAALSTALPRFLGPYTDRVVHALCRPRMGQRGVDAAALLSAAVPPRLLLPHLSAAQHGPAACALLLGCAQRCDEGEAAALWAVLLAAIEAEEISPIERDAEVDAPENEGGAVAAAVVLVLRLSEAVVTPMLLFSISWVEDNPQRQAALFRLAHALAVTLGSVFLPLLRHLFPLALELLDGRSDDERAPKRSKSRVTPVQTMWRLRTTVCRTLAVALSHDSGTFLDQPRFEALAALLIKWLEQPHPHDLAASHVHAGQNSLRDCLVAAAGAVRNDVLLWRPLHRQILMVTRSTHPRAREAALTVLSAFADRLGAYGTPYSVVLSLMHAHSITR